MRLFLSDRTIIWLSCECQASFGISGALLVFLFHVLFLIFSYKYNVHTEKYNF